MKNFVDLSGLRVAGQSGISQDHDRFEESTIAHYLCEELKLLDQTRRAVVVEFVPLIWVESGQDVEVIRPTHVLHPIE